MIYFFTVAPSLSFSMPCTTDNDITFGVSAIDMSLSDVFSQFISFSYGEYSYAVVIDVKGIYHLLFLYICCHLREPKY